MTELVLESTGVHEVKPAFEPGGGMDWAAAWGAARTFCLALMARRMINPTSPGLGVDVPRRPVLWCLPRRARLEHGRPYVHGLKSFGLEPGDVLVVEPANDQEALWVLEEASKSDALALVFGLLDSIDLTPARRLALASQKSGTPCVLLTHPCASPAAATASRWRIAPRPSAPHALNVQGDASGFSRHRGGRYQNPRTADVHATLNAAGPRRLALTLERYRAAPEYVTGREVVLEWFDEAFCFDMVADPAHRSHAPPNAGPRAVG